MGASTTDGNANIEGRGSGLAQLSCLLWNLVSTLISSSICSLQLAASSFMHASPTRGRNSSSECEDEELAGGFALYQGRVWHERRHPVVHRFEYSVRYALVDLDRAPDWFQARTACHHMTADEARSIAGTNGTVHLLTVPASVGYEQNPLSVYYCYNNEQDAGGHLVKCIAEVTNTPWAERVRFVFEPGQDRVPKPLHVSPFMDMLGTWRIEASQPTDKLQIVIGVEHPELGNYFCAKLKAERVEGTDNPERFFWLMPHKVALWIYWQLCSFSKAYPSFHILNTVMELHIERMLDKEICNSDPAGICAQNKDHMKDTSLGGRLHAGHGSEPTLNWRAWFSVQYNQNIYVILKGLK